ncbi:MAG: TRAP transporter large permease subunit, partial [Marinomonas sp.]
MELSILFGVLFVLLVLGVPVAYSLFGAAIATFLYVDIPLIVAVQRMAAGISVFTLMAIPFFIFAGDLMYRAGIADRLVRVADAAFGRVRGGLGLVNVGSSMMFGAVSGSAIASASAIGSTMVPLMKEKGYPSDYAVNVTVTAAVVGLLIPPSHNMIIYSAASGMGVSIGDLFLAGIVPGILTGSMLMLTTWIIAKRRNLPKGTFPGWREF